MLGYSTWQAKYVLDRQHALDLPTYSSLVTDYSQAKTFTKKYGGLYYLFRYDWNEGCKNNSLPLGAISRSVVSIRYPVSYSSLLDDDPKIRNSRVRCKIALPTYDRNPPYINYEYDGYVSNQGQMWWQWLLQQRPLDKNSEEDIIFMCTKAPKSSEQDSWATTGVMLTRDQSSTWFLCLARFV